MCLGPNNPDKYLILAFGRRRIKQDANIIVKVIESLLDKEYAFSRLKMGP
jgi:hypothetical protein